MLRAVSDVSKSVTSSLSGDVNLSNTGQYFDGPAVTLGAGGWLVSGTATVTDTAGAANVSAKLWDGTTVIASVRVYVGGGSQSVPIPLSGFISNPAADVKISVRDETSTSGVIKFNASGNSKDSTITAVRVV